MAHQVKDATVRLRALDGTWENAGTDRSRGVFVENLELEWDHWGPKGASFDLRRSPRTPWPDVAAFTDVEIDVSGVQVWKGRVRETPTRDGADRAMSIQCEGLQAHLDDDVLVPAYVHTKLSEYKDVRSNPTAVLTRFKTNGSVQSSQGSVVIGFPSGASVTTGDSVGVLLDLGPTSTARRVVMGFTNQGVAAGTYSLYALAVDDPADLVTAGAVPIGPLDPSSAGSPAAGSLSPGMRYIALILYRGIGGTVTETADRLVRIDTIQVFTDTAYESGNASVLKASTVVVDALARATTLLDPDWSQISATAFSIPDFFSTDPRSTREVIEAANAFHDYATMVDERGRPVFSPKPAAPAVEVGEFTALEVEDSSQNSGADIYNRVVVTGQSASSDPVLVARTAGQQVGAPLTPATQTISNPSFTVNTTGWVASGAGGTATITRNTSVFDTSPASAQLAHGGFPILRFVSAATTATGLFRKGVTYVLSVRYQVDAGYLQLHFGDAEANADTTSGSFATALIGWTPIVDTVNPPIALGAYTDPSNLCYIDSLALFVATPTLVDKRGFRRTKVLQVSSALDTYGTIGAQLGDTYLANHKTAQFKGSATIVGPSAREILTGKSIPPEQLGLRTNELLRFSDRIDPDTGAVGRDGRIVAVKYSLATDTATVTLDNTSQNFEALLSRLAVIQGAGS